MKKIRLPFAATLSAVLLTTTFMSATFMSATLMSATGRHASASEPEVVVANPDDQEHHVADSRDKPNIVFILADDMGYGDVQSQNPNSTVPTPHLNALTAAGMRFTDAHSGSAVCTPTRYGVMTGRYCWRTRLKRGVLGGYSPPLIDADRVTIASLLRMHGYATGAVGKWHLGMNMARHEGGSPKQDRWDGDGNVDFSKPIADGPTTRGFDYYFGVSASFDMAPYVWIENDRFTQQPTIRFPGRGFPAFSRPGPQAADVKFEEALDVLAAKASAFIKDKAAGDKPFFLYLPLTGPHKPVVPHSRFVGKSGLGPYGDFVVNVDDAVGQVIQAIDDAGVHDSTLVIVTSDNGSFMVRYEDPNMEDHAEDEKVQGYRAEHHTANGTLRGTKADVWEAGHRVPFLVRWPGHVKPGSKCDQTICLTDVFATVADVVGATVGPNMGEDSFSIVPLLHGENWITARAPVINHSANGMFAIRTGKWKLVLGTGSGGRQQPRGEVFGKPYQLYNLETDLEETTDVAREYPEIVARLESICERIRGAGRSRP